jgi:hypothetical protein
MFLYIYCMQLQRVNAFILLLIILIQSAGLQIWAGWQLRQHRAAMRSTCKQIQPHHSFSPDELQQARWIHTHEFELHGKRYDVVSVENIGSGIQYKVIADSREDRMRAQEELLNRQDNTTQPAKKIALKKLNDYCPLPQLAIMPATTETGKACFDTRSQTSSGLLPVPPDPPPPRTVQC